jgi:hypothetical protein
MVVALLSLPNRGCMTEVNRKVVCTGGAVFSILQRSCGQNNRELGRVTCIPDKKRVEGVRLAMPAVSFTR